MLFLEPNPDNSIIFQETPFVAWPLYDQIFPPSTESCSRAPCCSPSNSAWNVFVNRQNVLWISRAGTHTLTCRPGFLPRLKRALWEYDLYQFLLPYKGQWGAWPSESFLPYQRTTFETRAGLLRTWLLTINAPPQTTLKKIVLFYQDLYANSRFVFRDTPWIEANRYNRYLGKLRRHYYTEENEQNF